VAPDPDPDQRTSRRGDGSTGAGVAALIELDHVWKLYRTGSIEVAAVRDVSLRIEQNELVSIIGPSGSGKSTLMNILGCLDVPSAGAFRLSRR
jgi:putative ABC transport system ATP-binding protein